MYRDISKITVFQSLIAQFQQQQLPPLVPRSLQWPKTENKIHVTIGMRRTGKTCFLHQKIRQLLDEGISKTRIFFINLEDDRLLPMSARELGECVDAFYRLFPENHSQTCYFFFDEIQNVDGWAVTLRRLLDQKKTQIFIAGSSAKMLSKEIATSLRGRSIAAEIWPFSFEEYLLAKSAELSKPPLSPPQTDILLKHLRNYLMQGGFPEVLDMEEVPWRLVLQEYVNTATYRDIIERHGITNIFLLKQFIKTLLKNRGSRFSINSCFAQFKSLGIKASKNTLHQYLAHIQDAYLAFAVPYFSESVKKQRLHPQKIYPVDSGLARANTFNLSENWGSSFENLIYVDLRRRGAEIFHLESANSSGVDFIVIYPNGQQRGYQVCWDIGFQSTEEREMQGVNAAQKMTGINCTLLTPLYYISHFRDKIL